jgi:hypothetical protein
VSGSHHHAMTPSSLVGFTFDMNLRRMLVDGVEAAKVGQSLRLDIHVAQRQVLPELFAIAWDTTSFFQTLGNFASSASGIRSRKSACGSEQYFLGDLVYQNVDNKDMRVYRQSTLDCCACPNENLVLGMVCHEKLPYSAFPSSVCYNDHRTTYRVSYKLHTTNHVSDRRRPPHANNSNNNISSSSKCGWTLAVHFEQYHGHEYHGHEYHGDQKMSTTDGDRDDTICRVYLSVSFDANNMPSSSLRQLPPQRSSTATTTTLASSTSTVDGDLIDEIANAVARAMVDLGLGPRLSS